MRNKWLLFKGFIKKERIEFTRYIFDTIVGLIVTLVLFLLLFYGVSFMMKDNLNTSKSALVVGYGLFILFTGAYTSIADTIINEGKNGTLEQLYMSVFPFRWILIMKNIASSIIGLLFFVAIILITMLITGVKLNIDLLSILPLAILTTLSFLGLGLIAGGLALIFKKISGVLQIFQFSIIAFISLPINEVWIFRYFPGTLGTKMIQDVMVRDKNIFDFSYLYFIELISVGVFYLLISSLIYYLCEKIAMNKGSIGYY